MRIPTSRDRGGFDANITMTPMIDIVFQLLIFFICASTGTVRDLLLETDLAPGAVEAAVSPPAEKPLGEVWLKLERRGDATVSVLEGSDYPEFGPLQEVLRALAETAKELPVNLDIGPEVPMGDVIRVYDACKAAGFESINFATDPEALKATP